MAQRSWVGVLAALGGILIVVGGFLGFFLSILPSGYDSHYSLGTSLAVAIVAVLLGIAILIFSGYTRYRGMGQGMAGAIAFLVLGAITWVIAGGWLLVVIGSFLTVLAGLILLVVILRRGPNERSSGPS